MSGFVTSDAIFFCAALVASVKRTGILFACCGCVLQLDAAPPPLLCGHPPRRYESGGKRFTGSMYFCFSLHTREGQGSASVRFFSLPFHLIMAAAAAVRRRSVWVLYCLSKVSVQMSGERWN